ncbi:hypothetical protein [Streptomyces sp. Je 1-369]|uniref:hypothetical protein n=1 Tax=Streptomyces sp. Je 1-369 TaxID=2966192 RepID=UPI002285FCC7|nr:hypothetical protein [Streptomyces sp. Je 1-369]WAL93971.1 hypothetical protein NOO62_05330 [Streptomyces sp. Je 1-369]
MSEPIVTDPQASVAELLQRAADDYAEAQARREQQSGEDRVHGCEPDGSEGSHCDS